MGNQDWGYLKSTELGDRDLRERKGQRSLLEALFVGSESAAQLGLQFLLPSLGFFSSYSATAWREEWLPGTPFICIEMTKGHKIPAEHCVGAFREDTGEAAMWTWSRFEHRILGKPHTKSSLTGPLVWGFSTTCGS